ncbi:uncharacterized protein LOC117811102 [Xyrichtys novacula]|uniref:Uncharacterized protein LOC117811102 n=1 Tax=Xyrichtys novacula TaxID=13765 RepID=A0AAV1G191_XYRNO|nr:uncharacterized protein LOC117811102 [Xyrichtys novacula]
MIGLYLWILIFGFSKICSGYEVICTVSKDSPGVLYSVAEFKASDCWYSWADSNHTVLANHRGKIEELVERKSNRTLLLKKCKVLIYYSRNCLSEGGPRRGKCTSECYDLLDFAEYASAILH